MYDKNGNITREGAEQVIREGGSVSIRGKIYTTIATLPDEAAFANGDPAAEADARARLEKTIADAQGQLTKLTAKPVDTETKSPNVGKPAPAGKS